MSSWNFGGGRLLGTASGFRALLVENGRGLASSFPQPSSPPAPHCVTEEVQRKQDELDGFFI
jgi:hypothetical protein